MTIKKYFILLFLASFSLKAMEEHKKAKDAPDSHHLEPVVEPLDGLEEISLAHPIFQIAKFVYQKPESILTFDSKAKAFRPKFAFLINRSERSEPSYLAIEKVEKGSWQYAMFVDRDYIFRQERTCSIEDFVLQHYDDGTFRVQSTHGEESFLAVPEVSAGSYQWAIFATEEYIAKNKLVSHFRIATQQIGSQKDFLIETVTENPSNLILDQVPTGGYQSPYFAGFEYPCAENSSKVFDINTAREVKPTERAVGLPKRTLNI